MVVPILWSLLCAGEYQAPLSSDSDTSLILAVEVGLSDVELSAEQGHEEVKSWATTRNAPGVATETQEQDKREEPRPGSRNQRASFKRKGKDIE